MQVSLGIDCILVDLNLYVGQLTDQQKCHEAVRHSLNVQRALAMGNYHAFFSLYMAAPNMGAYIMDHFVDRERIRALIVMTKSYVRFSNPYSIMLTCSLHRYLTLPVSFIQSELAFESLSRTLDFFTTHGAGMYRNPNSPDEEKVLDCKPANAPLAQVFEEKYRKVQIKGAV